MTCVIITSNNKLSCNRKFLCSKTQSFFCYIERYTFYFDQNTTRSYRCYETFWRTFTFTHTYIGRLTSNRFVREDTNPNLTLTLHISCYSNTSCLYLTTCNPFSLKRLDAKRTKSQLMSSLGVTFSATFLLSSEFCFFRL